MPVPYNALRWNEYDMISLLKMSKIILITGGERSGKSQLACRIASMFSDNVTFLATAKPPDEEMQERIEKHQRNRPQTWTTVEEPIWLHKALERCKTDVVIIDCLTLWLSNLICQKFHKESVGKIVEFVIQETQKISNIVVHKDMTIIIVTNEIGMGVIPMNKLGRRFVELQGTSNQIIAEAANWVIASMCGQLIILKGEKKCPQFNRLVDSYLTPFRIGTTSYIYHNNRGLVQGSRKRWQATALQIFNNNTALARGSTSNQHCCHSNLETNVQLLAGQVEDIEIVVFESEELSTYPSENQVTKLCQYAVRGGLTYTVHFPLNDNSGIAHSNKKIRELTTTSWEKLYWRMMPLLPFGYVVHIPIDKTKKGGNNYKTLDMTHLKHWQKRAIEQIKRMKNNGVDTRIFCFENLDYPVEYLEPIIEISGGSLCLDIGHLQKYQQDMLSVAHRYFDNIRVIHFHWYDGNYDHLALPEPLPDEYRQFLQLLVKKDFFGVLTLEIFQEQDLLQSTKALKQFLV